MILPVEKLADLLVRNRFMTIVMDKISQFAVRCFNEKKLHIGQLHGITDCYIGDSLPRGLQARWILTKNECNSKDYELDKNQDFEPLGYKLYRHRDVKKIVFIAPSSRNNAVFYYRMELPSLKLWEHFFDIKSYVVTDYSSEDIDRADIVVFHRFFKSQLGIIKQLKKEFFKVNKKCKYIIGKEVKNSRRIRIYKGGR